MERGPIPTSAKLRMCGAYLPGVRAFRLSRRIADMKRTGDVAGSRAAKKELARLRTGIEFTEDVLSRERGGD